MLSFSNTERNQQFIITKLFPVAFVLGIAIALSPIKTPAANFTVTTLADNEANGCNVNHPL